MAATLRARRVGRSSHIVNLRVPEGGDLLSTETALNVLKQQIRSDWATLVNRRSDTITSARITIVVSDGALTHDYTVAMPAGQAPLGVRDGDGLDNSLAILYHNYRANLENMRLRARIDEDFGLLHAQNGTVAAAAAQCLQIRPVFVIQDG